MVSKNPWESSDNKEEDPWKKRKTSDENSSFDIFDKIERFFGKNNNGNSNGSGNGITPTPSFSWKTIVVIAGALYFASGFYQVQHDERGVVLRFGKWVRTVGPGLQYVIPYPFEEAILQKVTTVKQIDIGAFFKGPQEESLMLTGDSNLANISFSVLWKVRENAVEDYLFNAKINIKRIDTEKFESD